MIGLHKFRLLSADARGGGTRDEALRVSACEGYDKFDKAVFNISGSPFSAKFLVLQRHGDVSR